MKEKFEFCPRINRIPAKEEAGRKVIKLGALHGHALHATDDSRPLRGLVPAVMGKKVVYVSWYQRRHAIPQLAAEVVA